MTRIPEQQSFTLLKGDALSLLKTLEAESIHAVITDPPYGLTESLDVEEMLTNWLEGETFVNSQNGYAGAEWDGSVPGPEFWREASRVLTPGGFLLAFGASRTVHHTMMAIELAGFQIRDIISWVYAPGRQASRDQGRVATEFGDSELAERVATRRATLQPGFELIVVARKPFDDPAATVLENHLDFGTGLINMGAITKSERSTASNVWVVHDVSCTANLCDCEVVDHGAAKHGTHIYPGAKLGEGMLNVPKPTKAERPVGPDGVTHKTVKPIALMRTLVEAFTEPGQVVLDPFLGSGTTAEAALLAGRSVVGCELDEDFWPLIEQRIERVGLAD